MVSLKVDGKVISGIELVIFDKDGTLIDLYHYWSNMVDFRVSMAQEKLGFDERGKRDVMYAMGVDVEKKRLRSEGPVGIKKREIVMQAMIDALENLGFSDTDNLCFEIFAEVDKKSIDSLPIIIRPINGMHELIDSLHGNGCEIAIATTDKTERARVAMQFLGIEDKLAFVVGADRVENCKPAPDMVQLILKELSVCRENAVMVGDASTDVDMGINAGLLASIGVCSGLAHESILKKRTQYIIPDISFIQVL